MVRCEIIHLKIQHHQPLKQLPFMHHSNVDSDENSYNCV